MGSISNAQIAGFFTGIAFSNVMGCISGSLIYVKLNSISEYALGKLMGTEYGKDLNDKIFVYLPYRDSLWKHLIIRSISSLTAYKITSLAAGLLTNIRIPFLSPYTVKEMGVMFTIAGSITPFVYSERGMRYYQRTGVYLSPEECQNRNVMITQIRTIRHAVNIYQKESLWSLLGTPTLMPGRFDPLTNYET
jgi:hypothetical protein